MPTDIGDLRDVVDAINKLCDTMKTSHDDAFEDCSQTVEPLPTEEVTAEEAVVTEVEDADWCVASQIETGPDEIIFKKVEHYNTETWRQSVSRLESSEVAPKETERWSDSSVSLAGHEVSELAQAPGELSEVYYTASSEVSLLSDLECPEKVSDGPETEGRECAVAGHVAAMRERFESMTRANTPCPDRDVTPSPDHLG